VKNVQHKADILIEALTYIKKFRGKIVVIKYGGGAMDEAAAEGSVFEDINMLMALGLQIVLVHGGGPMIDAEMRRQGIPKTLFEGLRVTDAATLKIVEQVLAETNAACVSKLHATGTMAEDCTDSLLAAASADPRLGFVGEITSVDTRLLLAKLAQGVVPVVSSIGHDQSGRVLNINADTVATKVAVALGAEKLTILTNVDGVMRDRQNLISHLSPADAEAFIASGVIVGGMIPKVRACTDAVNGGVGKAHLMNAGTMRALLLEIFTDNGVGTEIVV
jgi:acetylglutamate kinase